MKIEATPQTTAPPNAQGPGLTGSKDEFLRLFMAQLQHQDPLSPKDGSDMVAQLAQFSSVEQATKTNQHLADLVTAQTSTSNAGLSSLVGRTCRAAAAEFDLDRGGAVPALAVSSPGVMKGAVAVILDDAGKEVRRLAIADGTQGAELAWDGKTATGAPAAPGHYRVEIAPGSSGAAITAQWRGRVDAVELTETGSRLRMGGVLLAPSDVRTIGLTGLTP